ncbi:MAG: hypothetical protein GY786_01520 [Proteobacteria bacterium]|nr:hypothetical protein [Pseudomonadota bacterium]
MPEKVPFRLTRVLVNAMEAFGVEGTFRTTCENVLGVLRSNKESLIAILEEFVRDPLITWRMRIDNNVKESSSKNQNSGNSKNSKDLKIIESLIDIKPMESEKDHSFVVEGALEMEVK